ncbi:MAG: PT domain-containing protein [Chloroflexi bacterium]|nr:PT domain-containing protein [Chloroflexota bacterium]
MKKPIYFVIALLILTTLACSLNLSSAKISDATLAKDADGNQPTTTFAQDEPFYCVVELVNAPDDTKVKAVWTAVEVEGVEPNLMLGEKELTTGDGTFNFSYANDEGKLWPAGKYKVDLYLNDKSDRTLEFQVEASAVAVEPTLTPEPTEEATATPEPEPTSEPTVETTEEPSAEPTEENAAGDVLQLPTAEATEESQYEPLPFKEELYVHPSKAFTFALPESFEGIAGDKTSVSFGDDRSVVAVEFLNAETVYSDKEMEDFIDKAVKIIMDNFSADDYEVLEQKVQPDDSIYVPVAYKSDKNGDGNADFFFEQRDTIIFVLYFVTVTYDEMLPTWSKIIENYKVDAKAALAAVPAAAPTPAPKPTQPPAPAGPSIPAGKGMLIYQNFSGYDFVIDIIGPTTVSGAVIPPNTQKEFILDPGHYQYNGHTPSGLVVSPQEFDIAAGQVVRDGVQ